MTVYAPPGSADSLVSVKPRYEHFIGGEWVAPAGGEYFENISPVNGKPFTEIARGTAADIEAALDAAHAAAPAWGRTSPAERANILNRIADRIEANLELLAVAETWDNGKPVREAKAAVETWRDLLSREASRDNRAIDLSWIGRGRTALPRNELRRDPAPAPRMADIPVVPPEEIVSILAAENDVVSERRPTEPQSEDAFSTAPDLAIVTRYPLLRNTL